MSAAPLQPGSHGPGYLDSLAPQDARHDPLVASHPGRGLGYVGSYWVDTAGAVPPDDGPLQHDSDVDVAIVGAGFTGLACALFLAREHGIRATVLEANQVAWGCTSRNGGQGHNVSGRLHRSQWIRRWGQSLALKLDEEMREAFLTFKELVVEFPCDPQPGGHLSVAHRPRSLALLREEEALMRKVFGYRTQMLSAAELRQEHVDDHEACGALHEPDAIGVHPLKLAFGYLRAARALGVRVHPGSPVTACLSDGKGSRLTTPGGEVRARAVVFATGGYTTRGLGAGLDDRVMPVLSNSMVTRPLTESELEAVRFRSAASVTDTRTLRFYYRRLPDNRLQIGSRSAITGADAPSQRHRTVLVEALRRKFPALRDIGIDHYWWGWVDVSHDMMPRVVQADRRRPVYYALGYGGNGVAYSAHAGRRMAQLLTGGLPDSIQRLPIYDSPLPYPRLLDRMESRALAPWRRLGQRALYRWYHWRDERT